MNTELLDQLIASNPTKGRAYIEGLMLNNITLDEYPVMSEYIRNKGIPNITREDVQKLLDEKTKEHQAKPSKYSAWKLELFQTLLETL